MNKNKQQYQSNNTSNKPLAVSRTSRSQAIRAHRQHANDAQKMVDQFKDASLMEVRRPLQHKDGSPRLKIIGLGGMDGGGSKNMILVEYDDEAIVIDCGNDLSDVLPGINYSIPDITYIKEIKNKLKAFVITHGHLDHIGGLPHILPEINIPIYASRFTIGMVEQTLERSSVMPPDLEVKTVIMNEDNHEKLKIGKHFAVELVRVTHSIPGSTAVVVDTPVGKIINTGDFRLDPEPLDHLPTDIKRFEEISKEGVLVLMSDSTTAEKPGRTPTESTLEPSFHEIFRQAPGRVFVAVFSSNINRIQMLVNAAVEDGRKIAIDGRSMIATLETAVRLGFVKIPKGTFVPMANINSMKDQQAVIICTGSQGEPNSALVRMSIGDHRHVNLKEQDTVIISATPIPESGNDRTVGKMVDNLIRKGVHVFRHNTMELDMCGPLHVSGHAGLEEYGDFIEVIKPKYFLPIYGSIRAKQYLLEEAVRRGIPRGNTLNAENGQVIEFSQDGKMEANGEVPHGSQLVDDTGSVVPNVVVKDRLVMMQDGFVILMLTIDRKNGRLLSSPDIITRGFIHMRENEDLMGELRDELKRIVAQRFGRVDLDRFKQELKDQITFFIYNHTDKSPIVIPVVNVVANGKESSKQAEDRAELRTHTQPD